MTKLKQPDYFIICGLDRLGKGTLIKNIQNRLGTHFVHASGRPPVLDVFVKGFNEGVLELPKGYEDLGATDAEKSQALYQYEYFKGIFDMMLDSNRTPMIFDRLHLGEMVYSPLYRHIKPNSIMELEAAVFKSAALNERTRLILLTENFEISKHFVSDGCSFDDGMRKDEQKAFTEAFNKSTIKDKRIICVTGADGQFRCPTKILLDALV